MAESSKRIVELSHLILSEAFKTYPGYRLVITGHSLGGGVAILTTMSILSRWYKLVVYTGSFFTYWSWHIWSAEIGVKYWNFQPILSLCFLLIFSWKKMQPNFLFWGNLKLLKCLNSKEIKLQSSIRVICIIFDLIFFSWKLKRKQRFQVRRQFQHFEYDMNQT